MDSNRQVVDVELHKGSVSDPWGFRLQGGSDFPNPLSVQRINPHSIAEKCGLREGDEVLSINNQSIDGLTHEAAKREIINGGLRCLFKVQRSCVTTWKPQVELLHSGNGFLDSNQMVQKTSLARDAPQTTDNIGSAHNRCAKPFPGNISLVNSQYNTPLSLYSSSNVDHVLDATADAHLNNLVRPLPTFGQSSQELGSSYGSTKSETGFRRVQAPTTQERRAPQQQQDASLCKACGRLIIGVFVKVRGNPMHADCFKCKRCGKSLKNAGYFVVDDELYCEVDAKQVATPPQPGLVANAVFK